MLMLVKMYWEGFAISISKQSIMAVTSLKLVINASGKFIKNF